MQTISSAFGRTLKAAGRRRANNTPVIPTTTTNSESVKALLVEKGDDFIRMINPTPVKRILLT
jgi:hypothetical protein